MDPGRNRKCPHGRHLLFTPPLTHISYFPGSRHPMSMFPVQCPSYAIDGNKVRRREVSQRTGSQNRKTLYMEITMTILLTIGENGRKPRPCSGCHRAKVASIRNVRHFRGCSRKPWPCSEILRGPTFLDSISGLGQPYQKFYERSHTPFKIESNSKPVLFSQMYRRNLYSPNARNRDVFLHPRTDSSRNPQSDSLGR
jgi:hypothetical protein